MNVTFTPYLLLEGQAKEAVDFYVDVFEATVESCELLKDWPHEFENGIPEGYEENVMHAHLTVGNSWLMLADTLPGQTMTAGSTITIMIDLKEVTDAENIYKKLSKNGEVITELTETSYSPAYAQVKDMFGIEWQIVTEFSEMEGA